MKDNVDQKAKRDPTSIELKLLLASFIMDFNNESGTSAFVYSVGPTHFCDTVELRRQRLCKHQYLVIGSLAIPRD